MTDEELRQELCPPVVLAPAPPLAAMHKHYERARRYDRHLQLIRIAEERARINHTDAFRELDFLYGRKPSNDLSLKEEIAILLA